MRWITFLTVITLVLCACSGPPPSSTPPPPSPTDLRPTPPDQPTPDTQDDELTLAQREQMVVKTIEQRGVEDEDVLRAMRAVPRHRFVPDDYSGLAYADRPLPIGYGQTISQPYIVAWMTELLELAAGDKVLEIGTGSGYQAAVLAEIPGIEVWTIEIVPELAQRAGKLLVELGYSGVRARQADGYYGWPEVAPFDAIIVTAAPDHLPQPLIEQLAEDGRLVIPIGPPGSYQTLWQFVRKGEDLEAHNMGGVAFVPFTGPGVEGVPR